MMAKSASTRAHCIGAVVLAAATACVFVAGRSMLAAAQPPPIGRISGVVKDPSGAVLPGVHVTLNDPAYTAGAHRETVTNADGGFQFADIPTGSDLRYILKSELLGFETAMMSGIVVLAGQTVFADVRLKLGCFPPDFNIDFGIDAALVKSDAVVHLKITKSGSWEKWYFPTGCMFVTVHDAEIVGAAKLTPAEWQSRSTIPFLNIVRGYEDNPTTGKEYLALLRWDREFRAFFWTYQLLPVEHGRIAWPGSLGKSGVRNGMKVEDALSRLRAYFARRGTAGIHK